jgi:protein SCO1/2
MFLETERMRFKMTKSPSYNFSTYTLTALLVLLTAYAEAQAGRGGWTKLDPLSFKGPDPSERFKDIVIDQKLGAEIPLDLTFRDEQGNKVQLREFFKGKPVILSLVYYECPMICNEVLRGMVSAFDAKDNSLNIGSDYEVVTVSIDPREEPALAAAKKENYLKLITGTRRDGAAKGWHFLVGSENEIETLAQSVGFRYFYDEQTNQYAHQAGIMILTPEGRVASYYLGLEYIPLRLKLALVDAAGGKIGTIKDKLYLLCYAYDPTRGAYGFYIIGAMRLGGLLVLGALVTFWGVSYWRRRRAPLDIPPGTPTHTPVV